LVLRFMVTNNDPASLSEIEEADVCLSKKDKDKLERMEVKQNLTTRASITDSLSLAEQVAASKIQRRFKRKKEKEARRKAIEEGTRRQSHPHFSNEEQSMREERWQSMREEPLIAESLSSTPVMQPEMPSDWQPATPAEPIESGGEASSPRSQMSTSVVRYSLRSHGTEELSGHRMEPRNPANVDGLDEPGRWAQGLRPTPPPEEVLRPGGRPEVLRPGSSTDSPSRDMVLNPPPGG